MHSTMMLQKTGSRLKQFIAHRRGNSIEDSGDIIDEERFTDRKFSTSTPRRLSWLSQTPSTEFTTLRRTSTATTRSRALVLENSTAHSSASSLCSCDCEFNPASNEYSLSRAQPTPPSSEILYLPPLSLKTRGDAETWRLIFSEPSSLSPASSSLDTGTEDPSFTKARLSTFDLLEALSIDPVDEDKTPMQSARNSEESDMENVSDDVDQLIRETDKAFQAVGNALEDAKAATQGWYDTPGATQPTRSMTRPLAILRQNSRSQMSLSKSPLGRSVSVVKTKRKKPMKKRMNLLGRALKTLPPPPANTPTRWTLTDVTANVVDVFSGKIFRTEVDEMLTPDRLQQIREESRIEKERKVSYESARSVDTDGSTPTEPFHLESLSSRLDAALDNPPPFPSPVFPPPPTPDDYQDSLEKSEKLPIADISTASEANSSLAIDDLTFPSPPHPTRSRANSRTAQFLPTIPEIFPLTMIHTRALQPPDSLQPVENHILLPSTPFTLTSPTFRHGPIRLERILGYPQELSPDTDEEPLDWTAFQMAISGTMDDMSSANDADDKREADEVELDDIMRWWDSFGFEGFGRLTKDTAKDTPKRQPMRKERLQKSWRGGIVGPFISEEREDFSGDEVNDNDCIENGDDRSMKDDIQLAPPETIEGGEEVQGRTESLPSSPMVALDPVGIRKDNDVPIPMGFNLGHDLGDFLNWETLHVRSTLPDR